MCEVRVELREGEGMGRYTEHTLDRTIRTHASMSGGIGRKMRIHIARFQVRVITRTRDELVMRYQSSSWRSMCVTVVMLLALCVCACVCESDSPRLCWMFAMCGAVNEGTTRQRREKKRRKGWMRRGSGT